MTLMVDFHRLWKSLSHVQLFVTPWTTARGSWPPCPSPTPGVYPNSCPLSRWCHPTISSSIISFSSFNLSQHQGLFQGVSSSSQVAFPFSSGSSQSSGCTQVSHIAGRFFTVWATREAATNGIVFRHEQEGNPAICNTLDGLRGYYAKWNRSETNTAWHHS